MPRIRGASIEEHHEMVWADLAGAMRALLLERDYDAINMGHIAARAGLARNTLYNYATDKNALVLALIHRAGAPAVERSAAVAARSADSAAARLGEIVEIVLEASQDQALQLMFRPGAEMPKGPGGPLHEIVLEVENVVRDGIARGEFRDVGDVRLTVELLSGVMRSGGERIGRDPSSYAETLHAARETILAALRAPPPLTRVRYRAPVLASNDALAAIIDRGRATEETDALLGALVDGGVHVPVDARGSVIFIGVDDTGPVLPGYTSEAARERRLPDAEGSVLCDVLRLLDIAQHTGVQGMAVFADEQWVKVPMALVARTLRERGLRTQGEQTLHLRWSTHPVAVALRGAFAARILAHPRIRAVWISHGRWVETGNEQLVVHLAVDAGARSDAQELLETILAEDVTLDPDGPSIGSMVLEPHQTDQLAELSALAIDTVQADHAAGRVRVVSREFD